MTLPVFVVDTNVEVAGLITNSSDSPVAAILDAMLSGSLLYLLSPALLREYRGVLLRPRLVRLHGLSEAEVDQFLVELTANAVWRELVAAPSGPDRGDDHLWALLDAHDGSILITGDRLLQNNPPANHPVIAPASWQKQFVSGEGGTG